MNPLDRYLALTKTIEKLSLFTGFNPFLPTWKCDRHRFCHIIVLIISFFGTFYSMYVAETGIDLVKRSLGLGIFSQTGLKSFLLIYNADLYSELIATIKTIYRSKNQKTQTLMSGKIKLYENFFKAIVTINSSAVIIFHCYPLIMYFIFFEKTMMFPFFFPWLDPQTHFGFFGTYALHSVSIVLTLLFHNAFDVAFIGFTIHAIAIVDLIKSQYDELNDFIENCDIENELDMKFIRQKLKEIIEEQKAFDAYVDKINKLYKWPCFVTSSTSIFSICVALIMILIVKWPLAYGLCWALLGQLFAAYINGEVINFQYSRLSQWVYNVPWYKLKISEQKMFILMIQKAAKPNLMMLLFIGPLDLKTFTMICNAIYSYYNICENLLK